jgi:hypothetical protein
MNTKLSIFLTTALDGRVVSFTHWLLLALEKIPDSHWPWGWVWTK